MININKPEEFDSLIGESIVHHQSLQIHQNTLDQFLNFSGDANKIHRTSQSNPHPVIPGNLLISLVPSLLQSHVSISESIECFTVGYRKIRFRTPIRLGDTIIFSANISSIKKVRDTRHIEYAFAFSKPDQSQILIEGLMADIYRNPD